MANETITAVPGVAVGHYSDPQAATGVTVLTFPEPNVAVVDVRGGAPGTRETEALGIAIKPVTVNSAKPCSPPVTLKTTVALAPKMRKRTPSA